MHTQHICDWIAQHWPDSVPSLVGALVGGLFVLWGQNRADKQHVVKMAIIATLALNPHEVLYQGEAAILCGLSPTTVSSRQTTGELSVRVNVGK